MCLSHTGGCDKGTLVYFDRLFALGEEGTSLLGSLEGGVVRIIFIVQLLFEGSFGGLVSWSLCSKRLVEWFGSSSSLVVVGQILLVCPGGIHDG